MLLLYVRYETTYDRPPNAENSFQFQTYYQDKQTGRPATVDGLLCDRAEAQERFSVDRPHWSMPCRRACDLPRR